MMKKLYTPLAFLFSLFAAFTLNGCKESEGDVGPIVRKDLPAFNKIDVAQNVSVNLRAGEQVLEIRGDGQLEQVVAEVENGELKLYNPSGLASNVVVDIWVSNLKLLSCRENSITNILEDFSTNSSSLSIIGKNAAKIRVKNSLNYESVYFELRDASNMAIANLQASKAQGELLNGTRCHIEGQIGQLELNMTDGCRFNLDFPDADLSLSTPVVTENCVITAKNGAQAWVQASNKLQVNVSDGSRVFYKGEPQEIVKELHNGGQVEKKEE
ncbi:DUF2807 domain-containing protein [Porifericola rhodea]|uniref:GIN domain-containing protein n=1 Tax=Porifericola rhodea TaxID=930972 RepID=UPI002666D65E|nr:DUF2807 domain-containing protein [Porifericola rhodea]WKN30154.1 DUF2807 domain-containing protein [Porifericola rhodea]